MRTFIGQVVSKKTDKMAVVEIKRYLTHPLYKKRLLVTKKYHVHDDLGSKVGDYVMAIPSRPYSKTKKWRIEKILEKEDKRNDST